MDVVAEPRRRLSPRVLGVALVVQVALIGALVGLVVGGLPFTSHAKQAPRLLPGEVPAPTATRFDVGRALATTRLQVDAGPRPAGSATLRRVAEQLREELPGGHFEAVPGQPGLRNIIGQLPGPGPVIVIGAHYDTSPGIIGANDSAAAVGTVLEIARAVQRLHRSALAPGVRFVLFDGQEQVGDTSDFYDNALRGSRGYVQIHAEDVRAMILLDHIGQQRLRIPREASSDGALWTQVRAAAQSVGESAVFGPGRATAILDDHTPFLRAGIPAVDVDDWAFDELHQVTDTYEKLDPASIDAVGETVVTLIARWKDV